MARSVAFGGVTVRVEYTPGRAAGIVDYLFARVPHGDGAAAPVASFRLSENPADGVFTLSSGGEVRCADDVGGAVASWLLHLACREFAAGSATGLLLHAAAVRWRGRGLLLAGASGSGKTTLTAFLTSRGFAHLTDELVYVPAASHFVTGFGVPLKLKVPGVEALDGRVALQPGTPGVVTGRHDVLFSPRGSRPATRDVSLGAIVFPTYRPHGLFHLEPLSPARTALRLLAGVLNGELLPDHGFSDVVRVAGGVEGYEMSYGSIGQVEVHLGRLREMMSRRRTHTLPVTTP